MTTEIRNLKFADDTSIRFFDPILLEELQINEIKQIALEYTINDLRRAEEGISVSYLTEGQKGKVIKIKDDLIANKSAEELIYSEVVKIAGHTIEQMDIRLKNTALTDIISLVEKLIPMDTTVKAQFKG